ncbi:MAG: hypothetical protein U9Q81_27020 [Pseudomonadota bacterium]|nr:hypothetical protein [Pseudomonadota bacterium]
MPTEASDPMEEAQRAFDAIQKKSTGTLRHALADLRKALDALKAAGIQTRL